MSLRTKVLRGLKWTVFGRLASQIVTWAVTIYVIRLLNPEDYGLMSLATIFSALFAMVAEIGLGPALVQSKEVPPERLRQIFGIVILTNGAACLLMAAVIAPLVAAFFGEIRLELVVQVIALQFLPAAFAVVPAALLDREMKFRGRAIADLSATIGGAIVTLILAYMGYGVFALAWGSVSLATIRAAGLNLARPFLNAPSFRFAGCGSMFKFGRNVAATQLTWFIYSQADSFIVGKFLGKHDLGIYSVSMDLASLPAARASAILHQLAFPSLAMIQRDSGAIGPYLMKSIRGVNLLSFPVMWGISSVAPELVQTLLGEKWLEAVIPLALLCLIMPLRVISPLLHAGLYAVGRADTSFRITFITACVMCAAFLFSAQFGLIGLSLAWLLVFPGIFVFNLLRATKHLKVTVKEIATALARPALVSGLMYGAVALVRQELQWTPLVNLVTLILVGAIVYALLSFLFNRETMMETLNLIRRRVT